MPEEERRASNTYEPPRTLRLEVTAGQGGCVTGTGDDSCNTGTGAGTLCGDVGNNATLVCWTTGDGAESSGV